jgi:hypothetical protein
MKGNDFQDVLGPDVFLVYYLLIYLQRLRRLLVEAPVVSAVLAPP